MDEFVPMYAKATGRSQQPRVELRLKQGLASVSLVSIVGVKPQTTCMQRLPSNILYGVTQIPNLITGIHTIDSSGTYLAKDKWPTIK